MAGAGKKTFTAGEVLTASDVNTYLMEQSVMNFAGTAARASAIPTPSDGMVTYNQSNDQIEAYNGSAWIGIGGLQLVKTQTIGTGVSSVTVTDAFSTTYENYKVLVVGGVGSTTSRLALTLGSTATGYAYATTGRAYGATGATFAQSTNTTSFPNAGTATVNGINAEISLESPFTAKQTTVKTQSVAILTTDEFQTMGGFLNNTTSYTAFTLTPNAGTLTGGTIYVYGYAKG